MWLVNYSPELIYHVYQREKVEAKAQWREANTVQFPA